MAGGEQLDGDHLRKRKKEVTPGSAAASVLVMGNSPPANKDGVSHEPQPRQPIPQFSFIQQAPQ
jgi:hypothetical protein